MPKFSQTSLDRLATCDPRLQEVANRVIGIVDFTILCGARGKEDQEKAFAEGNTKVHFPNSYHNKTPSQAFDAMPCPISWDDPFEGLTDEQKKRVLYYGTQCHLAGLFRGVAYEKGYNLTWGGDWNRNGVMEPGDGWDRPHIQNEG